MPGPPDQGTTRGRGTGEIAHFAGLTLHEAAEILELKSTTADRRWAYAKASLFEHLKSESDEIAAEDGK